MMVVRAGDQRPDRQLLAVVHELQESLAITVLTVGFGGR